jgi:hypothetical protein
MNEVRACIAESLLECFQSTLEVEKAFQKERQFFMEKFTEYGEEKKATDNQIKILQKSLDNES